MEKTLQEKLIELLQSEGKLPSSVRWCEVRIAIGEPLIVTAEYLPEINPESEM